MALPITHRFSVPFEGLREYEKFHPNSACRLSGSDRPVGVTELGSFLFYLFNITNYMGIITWIIFGALVGWIASKIMNTDGQQGALMNIVVGIIGAVVGGWIMSFFGETPVTGFDLYSFLVALLGAVVLIAIVRAVRRVA